MFSLCWPWFASILGKMLLIVSLSSWLLLSQLSSSSSEGMNESSEISDESTESLEIGCSSPPYIPFAHLTSSNQKTFRKNATVTYICDHGFTLVGSSILTCGDDQSWQPSKYPTCKYNVGKPGSCHIPLHPPHGHFAEPFKTEYKVNETLSIRCDKGFMLVGPSQLVCDANGTWQPTKSPTCLYTPDHLWNLFFGKPGSCHMPLSPVNGEIDEPLERIKIYYKTNETLSIRCYAGFVLDGPSQLICAANGSWLPTAFPKCHYSYRSRQAIFDPPRYCRAPQRPLSGYIYSYKSKYAINEEVSFYCRTGYELIGPSLLTCTAHLTWQPSSVPECRYSSFSTYELSNDLDSHDSERTSKLMWKFSFIPLPIGLCICFRLFAYRSCKRRLNSRAVPTFQPPSDPLQATNDSSIVIESNGVSVQPVQQHLGSSCFPSALPTYEEATKTDCNLPSFEEACAMGLSINSTNESGHKKL